MKDFWSTLTTEQKEHYDRFNSIHSERVIIYINDILGQTINEDEFVEQYSKVTTQKNKKNSAKRAYQYVKKYGWIK